MFAKKVLLTILFTCMSCSVFALQGATVQGQLLNTQQVEVIKKQGDSTTAPRQFDDRYRQQQPGGEVHRAGRVIAPAAQQSVAY